MGNFFLKTVKVGEGCLANKFEKSRLWHKLWIIYSFIWHRQQSVQTDVVDPLFSASAMKTTCRVGINSYFPVCIILNSFERTLLY